MPVFLQSLCEALVARDAFKAEGMFQVTVDAKRVAALVADAEGGKDVMQAASVLELGALLKRFISELQPPLMAVAAVKDARMEDVVGIAEALPKVQKDTLAYLVAFIRRFCSEGNRDVEPYAMIFGSNIMQTRDMSSESMKEGVQVAKATMQKLIADWDVSWVCSGNKQG